ncbi:MAG: DUF2510 domain-containing protein [Mycobacteriaceae bacterium]|nr:DUF2510 domain-containing protein [Mycobacteriaceae bacterium]
MSNIFNSLIWLVLVVAIVAVVVLVLRSVLTPGARGRARSEPPVVQQPVVQQPVATSGLAPGWYPDQNDPGLMRYFDGRVWTNSTSPRN